MGLYLIKFCLTQATKSFWLLLVGDDFLSHINYNSCVVISSRNSFFFSLQGFVKINQKQSQKFKATISYYSNWKEIKMRSVKFCKWRKQSQNKVQALSAWTNKLKLLLATLNTTCISRHWIPRPFICPSCNDVEADKNLNWQACFVKSEKIFCFYPSAMVSNAVHGSSHQ
jgi:hypothetical protein